MISYGLMGFQPPQCSQCKSYLPVVSRWMPIFGIQSRLVLPTGCLICYYTICPSCCICEIPLCCVLHIHCQSSIVSCLLMPQRHIVSYFMQNIKTICYCWRKGVKELWLKGKREWVIFILHNNTHCHVGNLCHSNIIPIQGLQIP